MVPTDLRLRFHAPRTSRPVSSLTLAGGSGDYRYGIVDWPTRARDDYDMTTAARTTVNIWAVQLARNVPAFAKVLGKRAAETEERTKRVEDLAPPSTPTCDDWAALVGSQQRRLADSGYSDLHVGRKLRGYRIFRGLKVKDDF